MLIKTVSTIIASIIFIILLSVGFPELTYGIYVIGLISITILINESINKTIRYTMNNLERMSKGEKINHIVKIEDIILGGVMLNLCASIIIIILCLSDLIW